MIDGRERLAWMLALCCMLVLGSGCSLIERVTGQEPTATVAAGGTGIVDADATPLFVATSTPDEPMATDTLSAPTATPSPTPWMMVVAAKIAANVRSDPLDEAAVLVTVAAGNRVQVLGKEKDWYKVTVPGLETPGWVHESVLEMPPLADAGDFPRPLIVVANQVANVRAGPSDENKVVTTLPRGTVVEAHDYAREYFKVKTDKLDDFGYIHQSVLAETDQAMPLPTTPAPTATGSAPEASVTPVQMYVSAREVANVRDAPSDDGNVVATVERGTPVIVYELEGEWYRITSEAFEGEAYIFAELVQERPIR